MPQMGVSVADGTIVVWRVEVGDRIEAEQTICEISTDKIDTELPAPATGVVTEILVAVDTTVAVGEVLARISTSEGAAPEAPSTPEPAAPPPSPALDAPAAIAALREHPSLNAWLEGERYTAHQAVHLGIAVSLGEDGLIVPVVHDAHELSVEGLAARIKDLARRARSRELTPDDVRGGTFTITNPGQYGSIMATPIINQPQVAILDLEAVVKRPVVVTDDAGNDSSAIRPTTILGLSWDHRALDGAQAAQFLASVKRHLEGSTGA